VYVVLCAEAKLFISKFISVCERIEYMLLIRLSYAWRAVDTLRIRYTYARHTLDIRIRYTYARHTLDIRLATAHVHQRSCTSDVVSIGRSTLRWPIYVLKEVIDDIIFALQVHAKWTSLFTFRSDANIKVWWGQTIVSVVESTAFNIFVFHCSLI